MDTFCTTVNNGLNDCSFQWYTIVVNLLTSVTIMLLLLYRQYCQHPSTQRYESKNQALQKHCGWKFFRHHNSIWIVTILLFLIFLTEFSEAIIVFFKASVQLSQVDLTGSNVSGSASVSDLYHLRLWSPLTSILGLTFISVLYQALEYRQDAKWLVVNLIYFLVSSVLSILKVELYWGHGLTLGHVKVVSASCSGIGTMTLFVLVMHASIEGLRRRKTLGVNPDLRNVRYLHYYSPLPSRLSFYWFTSLLSLGYRRPLEEEDLGDLPPEEKAKYQFERFNSVYVGAKEKATVEKPLSLWHCMFKTLWSSLLIAGIFRLAADLCGFVAPLGIRTIVDFVKDNNVTSGYQGGNSVLEADLTMSQLLANGYIMAFVILLSAIFQSTFSQCSTFLVNSEGIRIKVALQSLIYKKSLTLSPTKSTTGIADHDTAAGENDPVSVSEDGRNSRTGFDNGSIVHIVSEDTTNVMTFFWMVHFIWAIPLKLTILMVLLYLQLGYSALIGAAVCILIMIPVQFWIGKRMSLNSREMMERCDERLRTMTEILHGMKLLKVHGWEIVFSNHLLTIRDKELKNLDRDLLYRSIMTFLTHISSVVVTVVTFGLYPYLENERMEASKVFAGLALFNQLTVPLFIFPITVPVVIDAIVSAKRIRDFLQLPETTSFLTTTDHQSEVDEQSPSPDKDRVIEDRSDKNHLSVKVIPQVKCPDLQTSSDSVFGPIHEEEEEDEDYCECDTDTNLLELPLNKFPSAEEIVEEVFVRSEAKLLGGATTSVVRDPAANGQVLSNNVVTLTNCNFSWEEDRHDHTLDEITTRIPKGKLTVVVGAIGSGKSSLIAGILGEIKLASGNVSWASDTRVSYAAQKCWIQNGSVRDNIVFGKQFRPRRYKKVIEACSLQGDLDILPAKDFTEIGEKGINLSGGQKQRIGIARALYHFNANIVILDDVLSALDVEVAQEVFNTGIIKYLVKAGKSVLLATHHLPVLMSADHIIALDKGRIRIQGTLNEIKKADLSLYTEWRTIMSKKEADTKLLLKTGKERWALLKLVSKIGLQFITKNPEGQWKNEDDVKPYLGKYRKKLSSFSAYRNLSNDMFLPNDDCHDELMTPLLRRRRTVSKQSRLSRDSRTSASSNKIQPSPRQLPAKHPRLARMTSLQAEDLPQRKSQKVARLQSLPVHEEVRPCVVCPPEDTIRPRADTLDSPLTQRPNFVKRLLSVNTKQTLSSVSSTSATELDRLQRLTSTLSGTSESEYPDEDESPEYALLARELSTEEREYGTIPVALYLSYFSACGWSLSFFYLLFALGYEVIRVCTNFWLKEWSDEVEVASDHDYDGVMDHYFNVYVILSVITVLVSLTSNLIGKQAGANSREALHYKMLQRIVRCPMKFFDSTPIGRILNRFSSDVAVVDRKLCISMQRFIQFVLLCLSAIVVNALVNPWFLIVALPIVGIYYFIQRFYRFSSRELQRIEAISRGPIYSNFHETLEGLPTIRAFKQEERFSENMFSKIDASNTATIFINVGNRWLSISLDYLGSLIVYLATLVSMISSYLYPDHVTPSMVGLAINYTLLVPVYLNWVVKFLAEVEMFMTSVDRIDRYSEVTVEDYGDAENDKGLKDWPTNGHVQFDNVSVQYALDRPKIIHNLNLQVKAKEKLGFCGRSGSGKSSLLMSLFRVADVTEGRILIDDVDIYKIPLLKLRSSLSIIPQENILFTGSLRFNLDPLQKVGDGDIWKALELSQMKEFVQELPGQLDAEIKDGGSSFSAGQKQLLGLARAILHNSKVVILDEATSSVDLGTEKILLEVVQEAFKNSTVLTIAHRLETIVDGDRIVILDAGRIVEDGHPTVLQKNPNSIFKTMMEHANEQGNLH